MWVLDFLKSLWASYKAGKAVKAASELPAGEVAGSAIDADGKTIDAQILAKSSGGGTTAPKLPN